MRTSFPGFSLPEFPIDFIAICLPLLQTTFKNTLPKTRKGGSYRRGSASLTESRRRPHGNNGRDENNARAILARMVAPQAGPQEKSTRWPHPNKPSFRRQLCVCPKSCLDTNQCAQPALAFLGRIGSWEQACGRRRWDSGAIPSDSWPDLYFNKFGKNLGNYERTHSLLGRRRLVIRRETLGCRDCVRRSLYFHELWRNVDRYQCPHCVLELHRLFSRWHETDSGRAMHLATLR